MIGGYDLLNEPVYQPGAEVARFFARLARAVREADPRHLIVLEGNTWASDFSIFGTPSDANLVYSFHKYWNANDEASIAPYVAFSARHGVPLWLGETGENSNAWYRDALALVKRHEIGWCFWPWKKVWTDNDPLSVEPPRRQLGTDHGVLRGQAAPADAGGGRRGRPSHAAGRAGRRAASATPR